MIKRMADFLEKFAVASFAVGIFQLKILAVVFGIASFVACMIITHRMNREVE